MPKRMPKHIYFVYACETMKEAIDMFVTEHEMRKNIYGDFVAQNRDDDSCNVAERHEFVRAFIKFDLQVEKAFKKNYNKDMVLRRFLPKALIALNHTNGCMQFVLFVNTVMENIDNEVLLTNLLH